MNESLSIPTSQRDNSMPAPSSSRHHFGSYQNLINDALKEHIQAHDTSYTVENFF